MKNQVNKGFLSYLLIFFVIVVAIILSAGAIMMLSPQVKIFGYEYISSNNTITITNYDGNDTAANPNASLLRVNDLGETIAKVEVGATTINFNTLSKLVIKTNGMDVNVIYSGEENRIDILRNVTGFAKEGTVTKFIATKHYASGVFTITALETVPGLAITNNSKINVYLKQRDTTALNVEVESVSADLKVATSVFNSSTISDLSLGGVKFTTKTGNLTLSQTATISNQIDVVSEGKTNINVGKDLVLNGAFTASIKSGNININNLTATLANISGETVNLTGKELLLGTGNGLTLRVKNGDIVLDKVGGFVYDIDELAENLLIKIKNVIGYFTMNKIDLSKANKASIDLDNVRGEVYIRTSSGNVKIKQAILNVTVETITGSIYLRNQKISADIGNNNYNLKTKSGNIFVNTDHIKGNNLITSKSGKVVLNYLNTLKNFEINATSKGSINFQPENETYKNQTVIGYPSVFDSPPATPFAIKVTINTNARIDISAVDELVWFE